MLSSKFDDFFALAEKEKLYKQLIEQLKKDFLLARTPIEIEDSITPILLKKCVQDKIIRLIQEKFTDYLNLLYIIDVSEWKIKNLKGDDIIQLSEEVTFLILKREWQKVWYKNKY